MIAIRQILVVNAENNVILTVTKPFSAQANAPQRKSKQKCSSPLSGNLLITTHMLMHAAHDISIHALAL